MNDEFDAIERRLKKLEPCQQDALAARILEERRIVKPEQSFAAAPAFASIVATVPAWQPRSRGFASFSLGSALVGAMIGAAVVFLAMTFLVPPRVEIREVVREVRAQAAAHDATVKSNPGAEQPNAKRKFDDRFALIAPCLRDLDALIADRELRGRQLVRYESNSSSASSGIVPPRVSPEQYREILRDLKL